MRSPVSTGLLKGLGARLFCSAMDLLLRLYDPLQPAFLGVHDLMTYSVVVVNFDKFQAHEEVISQLQLSRLSRDGPHFGVSVFVRVVCDAQHADVNLFLQILEAMRG